MHDAIEPASVIPSSRICPAFAAFQEFLEQFVVIREERLGPNAALGNISAQRLAPRPKVLNLNAVFGWPIEWNLDAILVVQGNAEPRAEFPQFVFVEFLLLVRNVLPLARFAQPVALDGAREDYRRRAFVLHGCLVRRVHLARIVSAKAQTPQAFIGRSEEH